MDFVAPIASPSAQYHFGIGALLQRVPNDKYGAVFRVQSVSAMLQCRNARFAAPTPHCTLTPLFSSTSTAQHLHPIPSTSAT
jgi:hypothetical protein